MHSPARRTVRAPPGPHPAHAEPPASSHAVSVGMYAPALPLHTVFSPKRDERREGEEREKTREEKTNLYPPRGTTPPISPSGTHRRTHVPASLRSDGAGALRGGGAAGRNNNSSASGTADVAATGNPGADPHAYSAVPVFACVPAVSSRGRPGICIDRMGARPGTRQPLLVEARNTGAACDDIVGVRHPSKSQAAHKRFIPERRTTFNTLTTSKHGPGKALETPKAVQSLGREREHDSASAILDIVRGMGGAAQNMKRRPQTKWQLWHPSRRWWQAAVVGVRTSPEGRFLRPRMLLKYWSLAPSHLKALYLSVGQKNEVFLVSRTSLPCTTEQA
ncbi:hypothetical protein K438DRAFT_1939863 [Mycena galopus ATCC 62051]|nr:hypothetical protein K438DRAFT_1939863 [Mycena galopus ATCC 62051]